MRYSISNAIPHNPKSEKHPYENLVNKEFLEDDSNFYTAFTQYNLDEI